MNAGQTKKERDDLIRLINHLQDIKEAQDILLRDLYSKKEV